MSIAVVPPSPAINHMLEALGLNSMMVKSLDLRIACDEAVTATITYFVDEGDLEKLSGVVKRYHFELKEVE